MNEARSVMVSVRPGQSAFTLIEIIVVLVIIAIVMSMAVPRFLGARHAATDASVRTAAQSYSEAVDAFALDHAGRVPTIKSEDWPGNRLEYGPIKPSPRSGVAAVPTYLGRYVPEDVLGSQVDVVDTPPAPGSSPPATGRFGVVVYLTRPPVAPAIVSTAYRVEAWSVGTDKKFGNAMTCYMGTWKPDGAGKKCA